VSCSGGGGGSGGSSGDSNNGDDEIELPTPWTKIFGVTGGIDTYTIDVKTDSEGNSYVISQSNDAPTLRKFDSTGNAESPFEFSGDVEPQALEVFGDFVYVTGIVSDGDEDPGTDELIYPGGEVITLIEAQDLFICKFSKDLVLSWCESIGYAGAVFYQHSGLLVSDEALYISGTQTYGGVYRPYVGRFDFSSGTIGASFDAISAGDSPANSYSRGLAFNSTKTNLYMAVEANDTFGITYDLGTPDEDTLGGPGLEGLDDVVLVKFDLDLTPTWIKRYGATGEQYFPGLGSLAVDSNDFIYISGSTNDVPLADEFSEVTSAGFVLKFSPVELETDEEIYFLAKNALNNRASDSSNISPKISLASDDSLYVGNTIVGGEEIHVLKLSSDLEKIWEVNLTNETETPFNLRGLDVSDEGVIHVIGGTEGGMFGETPINTVGITDGFITTIHPDGSGDE
jgi:hypothetical protein